MKRPTDKQIAALRFLLSKDGVSLFLYGYASGTIASLRRAGLVQTEPRQGTRDHGRRDYLTDAGRKLAIEAEGRAGSAR